nr:hypothetical protein Iba_chr15fCG2520 [Ipomoea batatas]
MNSMLLKSSRGNKPGLILVSFFHFEEKNLVKPRDCFSGGWARRWEEGALTLVWSSDWIGSRQQAIFQRVNSDFRIWAALYNPQATRRFSCGDGSCNQDPQDKAEVHFEAFQKDCKASTAHVGRLGLYMIFAFPAKYPDIIQELFARCPNPAYFGWGHSSSSILTQYFFKVILDLKRTYVGLSKFNFLLGMSGPDITSLVAQEPCTTYIIINFPISDTEVKPWDYLAILVEGTHLRGYECGLWRTFLGPPFTLPTVLPNFEVC